nr:hypothetical protein GCM10020093_102670 [Planobispora longispora]
MVLFSRNIASPPQVAELTAALRAENPCVLVGIDEESGEVTRLEAAAGSTRPGNFALGVVDDAELTEEIARELGHDLARAGVNLDFAPSADVNSNPDNPVIGLRSFGADPDLVARHTVAWIKGLQSAHVAACAKHFPGHGDTSVDSHHGLPLIAATAEELHEVALRPFRAAIEAGVRLVMTGHLLVPAYDTEMPATLSARILHDLLRVEMGFDGVIITDGIEMAAVSGPYGIGGASARAIAAGADAVCVGGEHADERTAVSIRDAIVDAVIEGWLPEERLADAARRVEALAVWGASGRIPGRSRPPRRRPGRHGRRPARPAGHPALGGRGPAPARPAARRRTRPGDEPRHRQEHAVGRRRAARQAPARHHGDPPGRLDRDRGAVEAVLASAAGRPWWPWSATPIATPGRRTRSPTCWRPARTRSWSRWDCPAAPTSAPCTSPPTAPPGSAARRRPNCSPETFPPDLPPARPPPPGRSPCPRGSSCPAGPRGVSVLATPGVDISGMG